MSERGCVGDGAGWGTIEGTCLRVLLLIDRARIETGHATARALAVRHQVETSSEGGFFRSILAARAARALRPHLVHAVGVRGAAKAAQTIAAGLLVPIVLSVGTRDLYVADERALKKRIMRPNAVLVDDGAAADRLRLLGIDRELYVLSPPVDREDDPTFLGALEVVYGRVLRGREIEAQNERIAMDEPQIDLVQLPRRTR